MDRHVVAQILAEMAAIMEIVGDNPFKIRAYENAARTVDSLANLRDLLEEDKLTTVRGIGKNIAEHIKEIWETGTFKEYESLKKSMPEGLLDILLIPGVGAKKARVFYDKLGITNIGELEYACKENRLRDLTGLGQKSQDKILKGIKFLKKHEGRFLYPYALADALPVIKMLKGLRVVSKVEMGGSLRRYVETVKDIDIVAATNQPKAVMDAFVKYGEVADVVAKGDTKTSVKLMSGINIDLRCVTDSEFPYALHHFTGSKEHNTAMRARSKKMGLKMNEYGLFKGEKNIKCKTEEEMFKRLGLEYIPPELRENMGEIEAAEKGNLPRLIEAKDIKGIFHMHSTYSDGSNSIEALALAAKKLGYSYVGITDHSQTASYAGGLKEADIDRQKIEIEKLNKKLKGMTILHGIESDILPDGSLDYKESVLKKFDFIIGSVHSRFNMTEDEMTKRICAALENPYLTMLGHPTGRLLLARDAYPLNMTKVIDAAAKNKKIIEINANPHRLDIDWRYGQELKKKGVRVAICPDAHNVDGLYDTIFGVGIAKKAWLTKNDVVNTLSVEDFLKL